MKSSRNLVRVGTRSSRLALAQTQIVLGALKAAHPVMEFEVVPVTTKGDKDRSSPVAAIGVGVWVKELEAALGAGRIDMAVHSAKDLPTALAGQFKIAAVLEREDPRDALVSRHPRGLNGLAHAARVATGSARRKAMLLSQRSDLVVEPLRGNVDTRLVTLRAAGGPDAIILAAAGLARLGLSADISEMLDPAVFVPAVGQGALAIEIREDDTATSRLTRALEHRPSRQAVEAERAFLHAMGGGCSAPIAAHATVEGRRLTLNAYASGPDGTRVLRHTAEGDASQAAAIGRNAAKALLRQGAAALFSGGEPPVDGERDD